MGAPSLGEGPLGLACATVVPRSLVRPWVSWVELELLAGVAVAVPVSQRSVSDSEVSTLAEVH